MEAVTKFKSHDGIVFDTTTQCIDHEKLVGDVNYIMGRLIERPEDIDLDYSNGQGYIQQNIEVSASVRIDILELCKKYTNHKWIQQTIDNSSVDSSWAGRIIGELNKPPLQSAWYRFSCIDELGLYVFEKVEPKTPYTT